MALETNVSGLFAAEGGAMDRKNEDYRHGSKVTPARRFAEFATTAECKNFLFTCKNFPLGIRAP